MGGRRCVTQSKSENDSRNTSSSDYQSTQLANLFVAIGWAVRVSLSITTHIVTTAVHLGRLGQTALLQFLQKLARQHLGLVGVDSIETLTDIKHVIASRVFVWSPLQDRYIRWHHQCASYKTTTTTTTTATAEAASSTTTHNVLP